MLLAFALCILLNHTPCLAIVQRGGTNMQMEITKAGFCDLELVAVCTGVAMSGGNRFTAYIYKRLLPV